MFQLLSLFVSRLVRQSFVYSSSDDNKMDEEENGKIKGDNWMNAKDNFEGEK